MKKTLIIGLTVVAFVLFSFFLFYKVMFISKSEVKSIVMEHAKVSSNDVKKWDIEFDYEDGMFIYDVDVIYNNKEYNYEVNARTGEIIIYKLEVTIQTYKH